MKQEGRLVSSGPPLNLNFRCSSNDAKALKLIKSLQTKNEIKKGKNYTIYHDIFHENGAPYVLLKTNLCKRPIKLLVDTGASVSLVASDLITEEINKQNYSINLYGLIGKDVSIQTEGLIYGIFSINDRLLGTTLHLVNRKYAGPADGYLGYDFLSLYRANIDLKKMCLEIKLKDVMYELTNDEIEIEKENEKETIKDDNFLITLAHNYEFETHDEKRPKKELRAKNKAKNGDAKSNAPKNKNTPNNDEYKDASEIYKEKLKKYEEIKANRMEINLNQDYEGETYSDIIDLNNIENY